MTIRQPHEIFSSTQPAAFPLGFTETPITAVQERLSAACWMCGDNRWGSCSIKRCVIWQLAENVRFQRRRPSVRLFSFLLAIDLKNT